MEPTIYTFLAGNRCYIGEFSDDGFREHTDPQSPSKVYGVMEVLDNTYFRNFFHKRAEIEFWKPESKSTWNGVGISYNQLGGIWIVTDHHDEELYLIAEVMRVPIFVGKLKSKSAFTKEIRYHLLDELQKLVVA